MNMFIKCNSLRYAIWGIGKTSKTAPTVYNTGAIPVIQSLVATYFAANSLKLVTIISVPDAPVVAEPDTRIVFFTSAPQNPSVFGFKGPFLYCNWDEVENLAAQPVTNTSYCIGNWNPLGGDKVFIRALVSHLDGRLSSAAIASAVTVAP